MLRRAVIFAVAAAIPALAGCEAGINAPTDQWHQPTAGASAIIGSGLSGKITISNVFVLGAAHATALPPGTTAGLYLALANTGPADRLVSVSAPGTASSVLLPSTGVRIGRNQQVLLTGPAPRLILASISKSLASGQDIRVVLNFLNAGSVALNVPVLPRTLYYATFSPAPAIPTATPKPSATATASPSATPGTTTSPSATPSPTATP
jgi:copper(I)-binding protein